MNPKDCVVLVPVHGSIEPETEGGLRALMNLGHPLRLMTGSSDIALARSMMATQAMADGFAETLWVDADIQFDPADVAKLRAHNLPITAGLYTRKGVKQFAARFTLGPTTFGKGGGLREMVTVGAGFLHVRRAVYESVGADLPVCGGGYGGGKDFKPYFLPMVVDENGPQYLSEDAAFCLLARRAGFSVMADTSIRLGHIGRYIWTWDDFAERTEFESLTLRAE
jgi:hypothetical protein